MPDTDQWIVGAEEATGMLCATEEETITPQEAVQRWAVHQGVTLPEAWETSLVDVSDGKGNRYQLQGWLWAWDGIRLVPVAVTGGP